MKCSDELLQEYHFLKSKEEALFDEHQELKYLVDESETLVSEVHHFQLQLEKAFAGSQKIHEMSSIYSEILVHSQNTFHELVQEETEIKQKRRCYEDQVDEIYREYHCALQNEKEGENSKW